MVALRQDFRVEHARSHAAARNRTATVIELAGRHEFNRPTYQRRMTFEPRVEALHWVIGLVIVGTFAGAVAALFAN
jgi:hypothetical protein